MQNTSFLNNLMKGLGKRASGLFKNPYHDVNIGPLKLKYLKHLPAGQLHTHEMLGGKIHYTNPQELLHGLKELFIDQLYKIDLPSNSFIIDCGANIGLSIIYLKNLNPGATIIAFEPDDNNFRLLQLNVKTFAFDKVDLNKKAVWKENSMINFSNEGSMSSRIDSSQESGNTVEAVRLKEYLNQKVDFLKIDIEGAEYEVLKDIQPNLHFVQSLFLEYHGMFSQNKELVEILDIITKEGFHFYIKEATSVYDHPFSRSPETKKDYDVQLNIFCIRI
jgi:FkbM family methyltransferase